MATTKFYLDIRHIKKDLTAPLYIAIRNFNTTSFFPVGISLLPSQWDADGCRVNSSHPQYKTLNTRLAHKKSQIEVILLELSEQGGMKNLKAQKLKSMISERLNPNAVDYAHSLKSAYMDFMSLKKESTRGVYEQTYKKLCDFADIEHLDYEDVSVDWLKRFDAHLSKTAPSRNARNIHFRNIRSVFNYAIDNGYTNCYPFRRFKIRPEATRKRSLPVEELRKVFEYPVEEYAVIYRDLFKLIFMLIGINVVDLHRLKEIKKGRIEYCRAKTGRLYSIKVEPEAMEIIKKYKGVNGLLSIADRWSDHRNFRHQINKALQSFGAEKNKGGRLKGGAPKKNKTEDNPKGLWPELTTYWARHTWATIARKIGVSKDDIALALGHADETHATTNIYIDDDLELIDRANRKVLDWVLYGKLQ